MKKNIFKQILIVVLSLGINNIAVFGQEKREAVFRSSPLENKVVLEKYHAELNDAFSKYSIQVMNDEAIYAYAKSMANNIAFTLYMGQHVWKLDLKRVDVRGENYRFLVVADEGDKWMPKSDPVTYIGFANGNPDNKVYATIAEGFVDFTIKDESGVYEIEPANWKINETGNNEYLIYNRSDFNTKNIVEAADIFNTPENNSIIEKRGSQNSTSACKQFNAVLYGTADLTTNKGGVANTEAFLQGIFNRVKDTYKTNLNVELVLTGLVASTSSSNDPKRGGSSQAMLDNAIAWGQSGKLNQFSPDLAGVYVHGIIGNIAGSSYLSTVCKNNKYMWSSDYVGAYTIAHEWGHMFGIGHDNQNVGAGYDMTGSCSLGAPNDCLCMMCAYSPTTDILYPWSPRSLVLINTFLSTATCAKTCEPRAPTPNFTADKTSGCGSLTTVFTDQSIDLPVSWLWDFGDGTATSTSQNPTHTYSKPGTYTVTLKATNAMGNNTISKPNFIVVGSGTYISVTGKVGPVDTTFSTGGFFAGPVTANNDRTLVFDVLAPLTLKTVKVFADVSGPRTIELIDNAGNSVQKTTVTIAKGESRITLNFIIPPGSGYELKLSIGSNLGLWRINGGKVIYPFIIDRLVSINTTNAPNGPNNYYYYFFDWEVVHNVCSDALGMEGLSVEQKAFLYPNPTDGKIVIKMLNKTTSVKVEVFNMIGVSVLTKAVSVKDSSDIELDFSNISAGVYMVRIEEGNNVLYYKITRSH